MSKFISRKSLSIVLAVTMLITSIFCMQVFASTAKVQITGQTEVNCGDEVTYSVELSGNPGFAGYNISFTYDTNVFEYVNSSNGNYSLTTDITPTGGVITAAGMSASNVNGDGILVTITLKVKDNENTDTRLKVNVNELFDEAISDISVTSEDLIVNISGNATSTTESTTEKITEPTTVTTTEKTETTTERVTQTTTEKTTESTTERVTQTTTEKITESTTEKVTVTTTENTTETTTERVTQTTTEKVTETTTEKVTVTEDYSETTTETVTVTEDDTETTTRRYVSSGGGGGAGASSLIVNGYSGTTTTEGTAETTTDEETTGEEVTEETTEVSLSDVRVTIGESVVIINGEEYTVDAAPYIQSESNSTLVPLRFVAIAIAGGNVEDADSSESIVWDAVTKTASITYEGNIIEFTADSNIMTIDGEAQAMDYGVMAEITGGRMFVPFRALGEALGADVEWDSSSKTAIYSRQVVF